MEQNKDFLVKEPIGKLLFRLAIPTVIAQMINMLYNIVDRIYIGHIPEVGALALTGVGVCMPLIMILSAFAALVGNGGAPRASILLGKGDSQSAEKIIGNCFTLQILISIVLTVIMLLGGKTFLLAFGASENTIEYAVSYFNIYAIGTIFVQLTLGMNMFIMSSDDIWAPISIPAFTAVFTVFAITTLSPACQPHAIFAEDINGITSSSLPIV